MGNGRAAARAKRRQVQINDFEAAAGRLKNRPAGFTGGVGRMVANARRAGSAKTSTFNIDSARKRLRNRPEPGAFTAAVNQAAANDAKRSRRIR
jgi:hypothetical protein